MNLIKRAGLYIARKKGRSIALFLILLVMATLILVGLAIRSSAGQAEEQIRETLGSSFTVQMHLDAPGSALWEPVYSDGKYIGQRYTGPRLTDDVVNAILQVEGIKNHFAEDQTGALDTGLKLKPGLWSSVAPDDPNYGAMGPYYARATGLFVVTNSARHEFFRNGSMQLVQGRHINESDQFKTLVSEDLAQRNGLNIGDTFNVSQSECFIKADGDPGKIVGQPIPVQILGIYKINFKTEPEDHTPESQIAENFIFTDFKTSELQIKYYDDYMGKMYPAKQIYGAVTFFVDDPKNLDSVVKNVKALKTVDWQFYELSKDDSTYQAQIKPLEAVGGFATVLVVLITACCTFLLILILMMWTRSRMREIGILRSIGLRKHKIFFQLAAECLLIAVLAFGASWFAASATVNAAGNEAAKLSFGVQSGEKYQLTYSDLEGNQIQQVSSGPAQMNYSVGPGDFLVVCAIGAGIIILSVGLASARILRRNPRDILLG